EILKNLNPKTIIINAARGAIIDNTALSKTRNLICCLDTWENEPDINLNLLSQAVIATPHIAGYSKTAKLNASAMINQSLRDYFYLPQLATAKQPQSQGRNKPCFKQLLKSFNLLALTQHMQQSILEADNKPQAFRRLRRDYPLREECFSR
nr:erythronate-4-phosphate dehydrogenase [Gammaproteobacteria bacterium]